MPYIFGIPYFGLTHSPYLVVGCSLDTNRVPHVGHVDATGEVEAHDATSRSPEVLITAQWSQHLQIGHGRRSEGLDELGGRTGSRTDSILTAENGARQEIAQKGQNGPYSWYLHHGLPCIPTSRIPGALQLGESHLPGGLPAEGRGQLEQKLQLLTQAHW